VLSAETNSFETSYGLSATNFSNSSSKAIELMSSLR
jgi:hypothetical protein